MIIVGTDSPRYKEWQNAQKAGTHNGAYYYAKEIEDLILPPIKDLPVYINTVGALSYKKTEIPQKSIIVCHDNVKTVETYRKLFGHEILWICSKESVAETLRTHGENAEYIPLSVDADYVKKFKTKKTKNTAYIGNRWGFKAKYLSELPKNVDIISGLDRVNLLKKMAKYKNVIAEGRCLIEAKILGAKCSRPTYEGIDVIDREIVDTKDVIEQWHKIIQSHTDKLRGSSVIICIKPFKDIENGKKRRIGEIFTVENSRAEELIQNKYNIVKRFI
jgi:hypothetical protein